MKVLLTGGHLTPALALIEYLQRVSPDTQLVFVGREYSRGKQQIAHERKEVTARSVPFYAIHSGKLNFSNPLQMLGQSLKIFVAVAQSFIILLRQRPTVCVSFGSYLAVPVALSAWFLRIPIITHEQTRTAGFANRFIALLAQKVAIAYPESKTLFPKSKTTVTGNLLREEILLKSNNRPAWISIAPTLPILYITGGSQGSEIINSTVSQVLKPLLKDWCIIHQCGNPHGTRDYAAELQKTASQLPTRLQQQYFVREWITGMELAWVYTHATAAISRAGANSVEELTVRHIPTIFIPLPFALNDEQMQNVKTLSEQHAAIVLAQKDLSPTSLLESLHVIRNDGSKIRRNLEQHIDASNSGLQAMHKLINRVA